MINKKQWEKTAIRLGAANKACPKLQRDLWKKNEAENRANNVLLQNDLRNMLYSEMGSVHWLVDLSEIKCFSFVVRVVLVIL